MSEKIWSDDAWADYLYWQTQDKKTLKRINQLIKILNEMDVCMELVNQKLLKVIYKVNLAAASMQKTALYIIWKMDEFILPTVEDIMGTNKKHPSFSSQITVL